MSQLETRYNSGEKVSKSVNESRAKIYRLVRLTWLIPKLLELVNKEKIRLLPAVELSYFDMQSQETLLSVVNEIGVYPSNKHAQMLRNLVAKGTIDKQKLWKYCIKGKQSSHQYLRHLIAIFQRKHMMIVKKSV